MGSSTRACLPLGSGVRTAVASHDAVYLVQLLHFEAEISGPRYLLRDLTTVFPSAREGMMPHTTRACTTFRLDADAARPGMHHLTRDGMHLCDVPAGREYAYLEWAIDSAAVEWLTTQYLLIHAGAVARNGTGLILPAHSGSGKTTLTAALVSSGFQYYSDEVAAVALTSGDLWPIAKNLSVKPGSYRLLADSYACLGTIRARHQPGTKQIHFMAPPAGAQPLAPVPIRLVVFPRYRPGAATEPTPIPRSVALPRLLEQCLRGGAPDSHAMGAMIRMLQGARCFELSVDDLPVAVAALERLTAP